MGEVGNFWEKPLAGARAAANGKRLCDGCGKCCLHKVEDEDTGEIHATNVACKLLDRHSCRCSNYRGRRAFVPDCIRLTASNVERLRLAAVDLRLSAARRRASRCPTGII